MELNKFSKKLKNFYISNIDSIKYEFFNWLMGIQEDTPLPYEINTVCFIIKKESVLYSISYSGEEILVKLNKLLPNNYVPLEGQFFWCKSLFIIDSLSKSGTVKRTFMLFLIKELLTYFLKQKQSKFLKNKIILYGFYYEKPIYFN